MKRIFTLFIFFVSFALITPATAAVVAPPPVATETPATLSAEEFIRMDRQDMESYLGRKMRLGERLAFKASQRRAKKALRPQDGSYGNGMAVAGFVCGVVGLFIAGVILGPLAIVFSAIGMSKAKKEGRPLKGLAIAGLVLGIIATVGGIIVIAAFTS